MRFLAIGHGQGGANRAEDFMHVVRIDDERMGHFLRRARKLAENQAPWAFALRVPLSVNELLRDQIHPIDQRQDEADVRQCVERRQFGLR